MCYNPTLLCHQFSIIKDENRQGESVLNTKLTRCQMAQYDRKATQFHRSIISSLPV